MTDQNHIGPRPTEQQRLLFAVAPGIPVDKGGDGVPTIVIGIPRSAWIFMKDGMTQTMDLTKAGVPIKCVVFGGPDYEKMRVQLVEGVLRSGSIDMTHDVDMFSLERKDTKQ